MIKKRIATVLLAVVAAIALTGTPALAAWACPSQTVCFYWLSGGLGYQYNFEVSIPAGSSYVDVYVGEPVRSNAHSVKNNYANRYISRRYYTASCSAIWGYEGIYVPYGGGHNFNPYTTCFRLNWV